MEKKQFIYSMRFAFPVGIVVLFFGLIFAARSLQDDSNFGDHEELCLRDDTRNGLLAAYSSFGNHEPKFTRRQLTDYLAQYAKIAGRPDVLLKYMPTVINYTALQKDEYSWTRRRRMRRSSQHILIRPERAHKLWKRLQAKEVFRWPVHPTRFWVSSYFGPRTLNGQRGFHQGLDMAAATGTPVVAARSGTVLEAHYAPGYGNYVLISHGNSYKTRYAHLSRILVKKGQRVRAGQLIGKVGATGKVTKNKTSTSASHLHFEVYYDGKRVNPFKYLA